MRVNNIASLIPSLAGPADLVDGPVGIVKVVLRAHDSPFGPDQRRV